MKRAAELEAAVKRMQELVQPEQPSEAEKPDAAAAGPEAAAEAAAEDGARDQKVTGSCTCMAGRRSYAKCAGRHNCFTGSASDTLHGVVWLQPILSVFSLLSGGSASCDDRLQQTEAGRLASRSAAEQPCRLSSVQYALVHMHCRPYCALQHVCEEGLRAVLLEQVPEAAAAEAAEQLQVKAEGAEDGPDGQADEGAAKEAEEKPSMEEPLIKAAQEARERVARLEAIISGPQPVPVGAHVY